MKIVTVGDNCMDVYSDGNYYPGGNPVNVAVYSVRLGSNASYVGIVGNDAYGKLMLEKISEKNVDVSNVEVREGSTAITCVEIKDGDRVFGEYYEGVLEDFTLSENQKNFIYKHDLIVSGLWGNVHHEFEEFKKHGLITVFDGHNRPYDYAPQIALPFVDYFFYSVDEDDDGFNIKEQMKDIKLKGPKVVIVMLGSKGSMAFDGNKFYEYGIVPVNVIDTMGAGDSYIAGFIYGLTNEKSITECMALGAANASKTIAYNGAW